jgi:predicted XRE-type DNA-binding protein
MRSNNREAPGERTMSVIESEETITESSGNVFEDLAKARLVVALSQVIAQTGLTQSKVAEVLGVDQATVSKLLRERTSGFTTDRLMRLLNLLGQDVNISVTPKHSEIACIRISVAHMV